MLVYVVCDLFAAEHMHRRTGVAILKLMEDVKADQLVDQGYSPLCQLCPTAAMKSIMH